MRSPHTLARWDVESLSALLPPGSPQLAYYLCRTYGGPKHLHRRLSHDWRWHNVDVVWTEHAPPGLSLYAAGLDPSLFADSVSTIAPIGACPTQAGLGKLFHPCLRRSAGACRSDYSHACFYPMQTLWMNHGPSYWDIGWKRPKHNMGGARNRPKIQRGEWIEVTHGGLPPDSEFGATFFYAARGSGLWYFTGDALVVDDVVDIARYFNLSLEFELVPFAPETIFVDKWAAVNVSTQELLKNVMQASLSQFGINSVITLNHQDPGAAFLRKEVISFPRRRLGIAATRRNSSCPLHLPSRQQLRWGPPSMRFPCGCFSQNPRHFDCRDPMNTSHETCSVHLPRPQLTGKSDEGGRKTRNVGGKSCCMIHIEGSCSGYPHMGDHDWFDDADFGGPKETSVSACEQRRGSWQISCGSASKVRRTFHISCYSEASSKDDYIFWLHIPKTGTSFGNVLMRHANPSLPPDARVSTCDEYCLNHHPCQLGSRGHPYKPHQCIGAMDDFFSRYPPSKWFQGSFRPDEKEPLCGLGEHCKLNDVLYNRHKGHLYGLFRSPLKFIPSQYLRVARGIYGKPLPPYDDIDFSTRLGQVSLLRYAHRHVGGQVAFVSGSVGDGALLNQSQKEAMWTSHVQTAIRRLQDGFRFVGITEEWETTVCLFHRMVMRDRPCLPVEFTNNRLTSVIKGTQAMNASLGTAVLLENGFVDAFDTPFFEAVKRIFQANLERYKVTPETCAALKCTQKAHEPQAMT